MEKQIIIETLRGMLMLANSDTTTKTAKKRFVTLLKQLGKQVGVEFTEQEINNLLITAMS